MFTICLQIQELGTAFQVAAGGSVCNAARCAVTKLTLCSCQIDMQQRPENGMHSAVFFHAVRRSAFGNLPMQTVHSHLAGWRFSQ